MTTPRVRRSYDGISIYSPPVESWRIDLSDNTNLWGTPPAASAAIRSFDSASASRYPQPYSTDLRALLAEYVGVSPDMIVVGCGSDDIIDSVMRAFAEPGEAVCMSDPTFSMASVFATMNGLESVRIPLREDLTSDIDRIGAAKAQVTYLCSPNNPTGRAMPFPVAEEIVGSASGLVIMDAAYAEFGGESMTALAEGGRAVVTRTMSKAFGLAGLRIGYGIASPEIVIAIEKARGPYKVNVVAETAAAAALENDLPWIRARIHDVVVNRERFSVSLRELGYEPIPSDANFVLVPVTNCSSVVERLKSEGISVRGFSSLTGIGDAVRITIGPWEMMRECLDVIGAAR
jgi:histidinol-phosphate aminotransferase